ncbi:hypothetical protein OC835_000961 [Tilletia horrida]|nr:hypothetical protein OC835_000961 [Tilletia horrida]
MASFHIPSKPSASPSAGSSSSRLGASGAGGQEDRLGTGAMMFLGQRCNWHECHREDFLPFKCADCGHHYCADHFRPQEHACAAAAARDAAEDYRVPLCPICNEPPRNWRRGEDPNIAMERHLSSGQCTALDADGLLRNDGSGGSSAAPGLTAGGAAPRRAKRANECHLGKCHKIMIVPMHCADCGADFCPSHRAPAQHSCVRKTAAAATATAGGASGPAKSAARSAAAGADGVRAARSAFLKKLTDALPIPSSSSSGAATSNVQRPPSQSVAASTTTKVQSHSSNAKSSGASSGSSGVGLFKSKAERCVPQDLSHGDERGGSEVAPSRRGSWDNRQGGSDGRAGSSEAQPLLGSAIVTSFAPPALFVPSPRA